MAHSTQPPSIFSYLNLVGIHVHESSCLEFGTCLPGRVYSQCLTKTLQYRNLSGLQVAENSTCNKQIGLFFSYISRGSEAGVADILFSSLKRALGTRLILYSQVSMLCLHCICITSSSREGCHDSSPHISNQGQKDKGDDTTNPNNDSNAVLLLVKIIIDMY